MTRYILRRLVQMVPTLLGVLIITFILFNVVGGSPGLAKLGKNADAQSLEDFDEQRGFNKPLLYGTRVKTRAFDVHAWNGVTNVQHQAENVWIFTSGQTYEVPLAFPMKPGARYEWDILYSGPPKGAMARTRIPHGPDVIGTLLAGRDFVAVHEMTLYRRVENPFDSQFVFFIGQLARFDLGVSSSQNLPVAQILMDGIVPTLCLATPILIVEVAASVVLALLCAFYRGRSLDRSMVLASTILMSVNYLVWIVAGQYFLGYKWQWFPVWGFASWSYLLLPVLIGVVSGLGSEVRFYRSIMLDELYKDYVRTAFAKGLSKNRVLFKHVLRNALIPIITNVVLSLPFLYTGSLLLESFFGIPGLGYLGVNAINDSDVDVMRAIVVIGSVSYLFANLLADICYSMVDPRVRLS